MDDFVSPYPAAGVLLCAYFVFRWIRTHRSDFGAIPAVGYTTFLLSYITAARWANNSRSVLREGYEKYKGGLFKLANMNYWTVVVTSPDLVDDVRKASDAVLSSDDAIIQGFQIKYTIGLEPIHDPFHIRIVRTQLTRNLAAVFPEMRDELVAACLDLVPAKDDEWVAAPVRSAIVEIIARSSNRVFVGLPLCRDPKWLKLSMEYTIDVVKGAYVLSAFQEFIKPLLARLVLSNLKNSVQTGLKCLKPLIEGRCRQLELHGDNWEDKPNDVLMWLMEEDKTATAPSISLRLNVLNFAAIHTSSLAFTHALYLLAAHPESVRPLRDKVEAVLAEEGWIKAALGKMVKVDSFIRESMRINGLTLMVMDRWANKPFTYSNGVTVPAGVMISCAAAPIHQDDEFYPDGDKFNPFRFADMREGDGEGPKHQTSTTTNQYLAFGHGRHACPGRFFATIELRCLFAHIVTAYDVMLENGAREVPPSIAFGNHIVPADAKVLFRKRSATDTVVE